MKDAVFGESKRYGRLNDILLSEGSEKEEKMKAYAQEDAPPRICLNSIKEADSWTRQYYRLRDQ